MRELKKKEIKVHFEGRDEYVFSNTYCRCQQVGFYAHLETTKDPSKVNCKRCLGLMSKSRIAS